MKEELHHEPVYNHLAWRWHWRGIGVVHLLVACVPTGALLMGNWFIKEVFWENWPGAQWVPVTAALGLAVCVLQYRRDVGYFARQRRNWGQAQHLTPCIHPANEQHFNAPRRGG